MSIQAAGHAVFERAFLPTGKFSASPHATCIKEERALKLPGRRQKLRMGPSSETAAPKSRLSWLVATFFGIGFLPPGPGTWASAATVVLWWGASHLVRPAWLVPAAVLVSLAITIIGIPPSTVVARESGRKDPGFVVIDEVAGQMIALIGVPLSWKYLLASFILFRSFDIVKPYPLRRMEGLPGGTGIMMDDVGAGLYALALLQIWLHFMAR
jgi:phosphatidylglycerophosphatase A